uniref:exosortase A n=1 Tax=Qipengyuania pacifica TaxID=2860199 RepID=UPI0035C7D21F
AICFVGRSADINLIAQLGVILAFQGATFGILGLRVGLILAFPLAYMFFLVPFGDEIIPPLQYVTAEMATALTRFSGVETVADGIHIDTPAGLFIVAEECSGVKFLVAMVALGVLVAYSCFASWKRRMLFLLACVIVPIVANGIRAWATIFIAQYVGAEAAGSFDHIVYGWFFFGIVIALVLGVAWRWFEREPEEAGWSAQQVSALPMLQRLERNGASPALVLGATLTAALVFAVMPRLG